MVSWTEELETAARDFLVVARLAQAPLRWEDLELEYLEAPHRPVGLPEGKMALYGFWYQGEWLKIGMAGPNSNARFMSQHYIPGSAKSTLAASLLNDDSISLTENLNSANIKDWLKMKTNRANIFLDARHGQPLLCLFESFLHVRLKPRYEK